MKNNLKAIGILISLSIFWYGVSSVASFYRTINSVEAVEIETKVGENTEDIFSDVIPEDIEAVEGTCPECEKEEGEVLGDTSCKSVLNELVTTPVFMDGSTNLDYTHGIPSGEMVSKEAKIEIVEVTVPAVLLAGASQVKDSNRLISMESVSYSAGGNLFDSDYGRKLESPSSAKDYDRKINGSVYKQDFGSETEMKPTQIEGEGAFAKINIGTEKESICLDCQDSNYNPDKGNKVASEIILTMSIPGGQKEAPLNEEDFLNIDSGMVEELPSAGLEDGCKRVKRFPFRDFVRRISSEVFSRCNNPDEDGNYSDECIKPESIVIRTNSFFGNYDTCKDEDKCINTFMNRRSLSMLSPVKASEFDQDFLVTTPCTVSIEGKPFGVKCLWDVSYIALEYYYQYQNNNPGKEFPVWSVFWEAIEKDLLERV